MIAVGGSRCSSEASARNSLERCRDCASDWLSPVASVVDTPQAVLVLMPVVSDCDVPCDLPVSPERVLPPANGSKLLSAELEWPLPRDADSLSELEAETEAEPPTVLVYETPVESVTEVPMVSVSWESTKRCSVP